LQFHNDKKKTNIADEKVLSGKRQFYDLTAVTHSGGGFSSVYNLLTYEPKKICHKKNRRCV